ncbi:cytochrome c [Neobacillus pocheonensis]|uniref:Cytochrome c n=1 Tax=Neobacillus pocheonensis TaxID=363869 RepID=A0ABT0W8S4_9BACI|nr:cytochrome c [Neobacillus pocheonensis]
MEKPIFIIPVILLVAVILFVNVVFLHPAKENKTATPAKTEKTASTFDPVAFYKQTCIGCHGDQYQGVVGPTLKNLSSKYKQADVENILKNGKGGVMPAGLVKDEDIPAMAKWVLSLK